MTSDVNARIWQGTGILLVISIGGFSIINWNAPQSPMDSITGIIVSFISILILFIWVLVFNRFMFVQGILGYRAREIEQELGLRLNLYARSIEYWKGREDIKTYLDSLEKENKESYDRLFQFRKRQMKKKLGRITIRTTLTCLTLLLVVMWFYVIFVHFKMLLSG